MIMAEIFATVHQKRIIELAAQHHLPAIYPFDFFARNGGLMSYGVDINNLFARAASYVDRILKGVESERNILQLEQLCEVMLQGSLCGLGGMTPFPVTSALKHFREDFLKFRNP